MMGRLDRIPNAPTHAPSRHSRRTYALPSSRDALHPLLAQSGGSQDGPLSREAPRHPYDFPMSPARRQAPPVVQAKLAISAPGDEAEKEADGIADRVMRMPNSQRKGAFARREERPKFQATQMRPVAGPVQ